MVSKMEIRNFCVLLVVASIASPSTVRPAQQAAVEAVKSSIDVPAGREPVLDGKMEADEWRDAAVIAATTGKDSVELVAKHHDGTLYLGIRRQRAGITTIGVALGEKVLVLHASASLGSAEYRPAKGSFDMVRGFEWRCSEASSEETLRKERREHLAAHHWLGTTMKMGTGQAEFAIAAPLQSGAKGEPKTLRFALSLMGGSALRVPKELDDGLTNTQLQMGHTPPKLQFSPNDWIVVRLVPSGAASTKDQPK
jgi:hypothetical protein